MSGANSVVVPFIRTNSPVYSGQFNPVNATVHAVAIPYRLVVLKCLLGLFRGSFSKYEYCLRVSLIGPGRAQVPVLNIAPELNAVSGR